VRDRFESDPWAWTLIVMTIASAIIVFVGVALVASSPLVFASLAATVLAILTSALAVISIERHRSTENLINRHDANEAGLARHISAQASAVRKTAERARALTARISVMDEETAAMLSLLDEVRVRSTDMSVAVDVNAATAPAPDASVDVTRAIGRALDDLSLAAELEPAQIHSQGSRRHLECALRLILRAMTVDGDDRLLIRVQRLDGRANITIATDGDGPPPSALAGLDTEPHATFTADHDALPLSIARSILERMGGDVAFVRALGWSNLVVTMEATDQPQAEGDPPILSLELPLDATPSPTYDDLTSPPIK